MAFDTVLEPAGVRTTALVPSMYSRTVEHTWMVLSLSYHVSKPCSILQVVAVGGLEEALLGEGWADKLEAGG